MNVCATFLAICCVLCYAAAHPVPGIQTNAPDVTELPLTIRKGAAIIRIKINDNGPYNVAIATCLNRSTLTWDVKKEAGLPLMYTMDPTKQKGNYVRVSGLRVGNIEAEVLYMQLGDLSKLSQDFGLPLHGVLGYDFLKGRVVQIDYKNEKLRFLPKTRNAKDHKTIDSPSPSQPFNVAMEIVGEDRNLVIDGLMVNGVKFKAMVDTWQNLPLSLTPNAIKKLNLTEVAEKSPPRIGSVDTLQLGPLKMDSPQTAYFSKGTGLDHGLEKYGAIIGGGFLKEYSVTFDYINHQVIFE
jgi:hypothetical protein